MSAVTINIQDEVLEILKRQAKDSKITLEEMLVKHIMLMVESPDKNVAMEQATEYVLRKNEELLKRLA